MMCIIKVTYSFLSNTFPLIIIELDTAICVNAPITITYSKIGGSVTFVISIVQEICLHWRFSYKPHVILTSSD